MSITFRPGVREAVGLWINLIGGTGSGKSFTGMRLASGICGDKPFAVIDTENRRALHYADRFRFDHAEMREPFTPDAYRDTIKAADAAGYPVIMIDSGSHVWAGDGGVLDWHEAELDRMAGTDWQKREACNMAAWIKPKGSHKKMVSSMLQVKAHVILCLRAEPKVEMVKDGGKWKIQPKESLTGLDGWLPICEKNLPFEATASFLFMASNPGIPHPIKLQEQHRDIFPLDQQVNEESGRRLAAWAKGNEVIVSEDDVKACVTQEMLAALWNSLSPVDKKRLLKVKDEVKAKIGAELRTTGTLKTATGDYLAMALSHVKAGRFDEARDLKGQLSEADQKFVDDEIEAMKGVVK